MTFEKQQ